METKYGTIPNRVCDRYKDRLVNSIYKVLPMKEEKSKTINTYISSLIYELVGLEKIADDTGEICSLIAILENLIEEEDLKVVKREVFRAINIVKR